LQDFENGHEKFPVQTVGRQAALTKMRANEEAAQSDYGQVANQLRDNEGTKHRR